MVSHDLKLRQTQTIHIYHLWLQMSDVTTYLLLIDEGDQLNIKGDAQTGLVAFCLCSCLRWN